MAEPTGKEKEKVQGAPATGSTPAVEEGHYEEVAEYRIGEGPPPLGLIVAFALIVIWATVSWIPFFGY